MESTKLNKKIQNERRLIYEMINASWELAAKKGKHPLEKGCHCITCVDRRKRLLEPEERNWNFFL